MNRRAYLILVFALAVGYMLAGSPTPVQAQAFAGKWVHQGPRGTSVLEFYPGDRRILGPMRGGFRHSIVLDDGRVVEGEGHYVFRSIGPNRGWLILHFADGHVTREHEHVTGATVLSMRHHGIVRNYVRQ